MSLVSGGVPPTQSFWASQVSAPSQNWLLSQNPLSGVCTTTSLVSSQVSAVQSTASVVLGGVPAWQSLTASQLSTPSQKRVLSQAALSGVWTTLSAASSQVSTVHPTLSVRVGGAPF